MANNVVDSAKPNEIQEISLDRDVKKRIIIGVALAQNGIDFIGQYAFIMYIDMDNSGQSIMLDASGHYGTGRASDVVDGHQIPIDIDAYIKYWDTKEYLYTFEPILKKSDTKKIKDLIEAIEGRQWLGCTERASALLTL